MCFWLLPPGGVTLAIYTMSVWPEMMDRVTECPPVRTIVLGTLFHIVLILYQVSGVYFDQLPHLDDLVVSMSASHTVGRGFGSRPGNTKDHHKNGTNCFPAWHADIRLCRSLTMQPDCLKGQVVCGTVYGDMHLKDLLGSIARVG